MGTELQLERDGALFGSTRVNTLEEYLTAPALSERPDFDSDVPIEHIARQMAG